MWEICTTYSLPLFYVRVPTLYIMGFTRLYFFITDKHGQLFMFHEAKINNTAIMVRNLTSPQLI